MRRFFLENIPATETFHLPEEESKHIIRVLRYEVGDEFLLLDGKGLLLQAKVLDAHPKKCLVQVINRHLVPKPEGGFHLVIAPTKNADRMEWMIEKVVEIGATRVSFIQCERSERIQLKLDRLHRVAVSAMKQSEQDYLIQLDNLISFKDFVRENPGGGIAHCMKGDKLHIKDLAPVHRILIGPEGDFSPQELNFALENGYKAVHLGTSRLRTETAGLVACILAINL